MEGAKMAKYDLPEWIYIGAKVRVIRFGPGNPAFQGGTVDRLTATLIVLANGERFSRATLLSTQSNGHRSQLEQVA